MLSHIKLLSKDKGCNSFCAIIWSKIMMLENDNGIIFVKENTFLRNEATLEENIKQDIIIWFCQG